LKRLKTAMGSYSKNDAWAPPWCHLSIRPAPPLFGFEAVST
jgi:hypothetical protein